MTDEIILRALDTLNYSQKWLEYGFIDEDLLIDQFNEFHSSDDKKTAHYRYSSFIKFLDSVEKITDEQLKQLVELCVEDEDKLTAGAALMKLIKYRSILTLEQLTEFEKHEIVAADDFQSAIKAQKLKIKLETHELTQELMDEIIEFGDGSIQMSLLDREDITDDFMKMLRDKGVNVTVQIKAKNLLRKRRFNKNK